MAIPIAISHCGDARYLPYCLAQARSSNPESEIYLIGDDRNRHYSGKVNHINVRDFQCGAGQFAEIYQHRNSSPDSYTFTLFCFQRWYILRDLMRDRGISSCFHIDSDCFLYSRLSQDDPRFRDFPMALSMSERGIACGHNAHVTISGIEEFCDFMTDLYRDFDSFINLYHDRFAHKTKAVFDMIVLTLFYEHNSVRISLLSEVYNGSRYDHNINFGEGYRLENGMKDVSWSNGCPYGQDLESQQNIRFDSLHFQGRAKKKISKEYFRGRRLLWYFYIVKHYANDPEKGIGSFVVRQLSSIRRRVFQQEKLL